MLCQEVCVRVSSLFFRNSLVFAYFPLLKKIWVMVGLSEPKKVQNFQIHRKYNFKDETENAGPFNTHHTISIIFWFASKGTFFMVLKTSVLCGMRNKRMWNIKKKFSSEKRSKIKFDNRSETSVKERLSKKSRKGKLGWTRFCLVTLKNRKWPKVTDRVSTAGREGGGQGPNYHHPPKASPSGRGQKRSPKTAIHATLAEWLLRLKLFSSLRFPLPLFAVAFMRRNAIKFCVTYD